LLAAVDSVKSAVHRNYLPGHKQGGSVCHRRTRARRRRAVPLERSPRVAGRTCG
jgi:hypothetical protein